MYAVFKKFYNRYFSKERIFVNQIRAVTGITPLNLSLYRIAFTHSSLRSEVGRNNERLELLGDAVFDLVVSEYLYKRYPFKDEGFLSEMRSKIVSRSQINKLADNLGMGQLLEANLSERRIRNSSTLGNAFEALLGAIYLDQGYNKVYSIIYNKILAVHFDLNELQDLTVNFKSAIIHYCQKNNYSYNFRLEKEEQTKGGLKFTIGLYIEDELMGRASKFSKKQAEQTAAKRASEKIDLSDIN